ncbi:hypothetical protein Pan44_28780 [Caulifigura coniformis]|uniref:Uncharacterized protein n=1 Tax=Caulifigura coniformis TaxID=2527983 RepID=A0A517SFG8_9PLAN|nr:hypothetical protein [Caulifigura coniformis]QDT54840.1 hypothetical protein Pan44_28780 [Caulifigura coniformis]
MSEQLSAEELRRLMDVVRHRMSGEAANVASSAKRLADWRFYLHEFTGPVLAAAGVVGFLLVPKKQKPVADLDQLQRIAEKKGWIVDPATVTPNRKPSLVESGMNLAGNMLLRAGIAFAGQQVGKIFGHEMADQTTGEHHA